MPLVSQVIQRVEDSNVAYSLNDIAKAINLLGFDIVMASVIIGWALIYRNKINEK